MARDGSIDPRRAGTASQGLRLPPQPGPELRRPAGRPLCAGPAHPELGLREGLLLAGPAEAATQGHRPAPRPRRGHRGPAAGTSTAARKFDDLTAHRPARADPPGDRPRAADHPRHGPARRPWARASGPDRGPAAHRQDDPLAAHQPRPSRTNYPEMQADHAADRRAARGSDRHAPHRQGRGGRQQPRPRHREPRPPAAVGRRARQAAGRDGQGRRSCCWTPSPGWPGPSTSGSATRGRTMSGGVDIKAMDIPEEAVRHGPALRGRRLADDRRHRPDRHRQPHGRVDLPGVQGHRQHGAGARPQAGRPPRLAGDRHQPVRHAQGEATPAAGDAASGDAAAAHAWSRCTPSRPWRSLVKQTGQHPSNAAFLDKIGAYVR